MSNPNPIQPPEFLAQQGKLGDRPLGDPIACRFPVEVDVQLRQMSDRQGYIRAAVQEKLERDKLIDPEDEG